GCLAVSSDGKTVATADQYGTVRLWDWTTGKELLALPGRQDLSSAFRFMADGKRLLSHHSITVPGSPPAFAFDLWDAATGKRLTRIPREKDASYMCLSADGRVLAEVQARATVEVRELATK